MKLDILESSKKMESIVFPNRLYYRPSAFPTVVNEIRATKVVLVSHLHRREQKEYVSDICKERGIEVYSVDVPDSPPTRPSIEQLKEALDLVRPETIICVGSVHASYHCAAAFQDGIRPEFVYVASDNRPIPVMLGYYMYMGKTVHSDRACPDFVVLDSVITDISVDAIQLCINLAESKSKLLGSLTEPVKRIGKELLGTVKLDCPEWREKATNLVGTLMLSRPEVGRFIRQIKIGF